MASSSRTPSPLLTFPCSRLTPSLPLLLLHLLVSPVWCSVAIVAGAPHPCWCVNWCSVQVRLRQGAVRQVPAAPCGACRFLQGCCFGSACSDQWSTHCRGRSEAEQYRCLQLGRHTHTTKAVETIFTRIKYFQLWINLPAILQFLREHDDLFWLPQF